MQRAVIIAMNLELDDYINCADYCIVCISQVGNAIRHSFRMTQLGSDISHTGSRFVLNDK